MDKLCLALSHLITPPQNLQGKFDFQVIKLMLGNRVQLMTREELGLDPWSVYLEPKLSLLQWQSPNHLKIKSDVYSYIA